MRVSLKLAHMGCRPAFHLLLEEAQMIETVL
jgi:hypothetical protein